MKRDANHEAAADGLAELIRIVRELRARCPWDREQTLASLGKHLIEEAYEAADAIAHGTTAAIADELGDLVTQGLFAAIVAEDTGQFALDARVEPAACVTAAAPVSRLFNQPLEPRPVETMIPLEECVSLDLPLRMT